MSLLHDIPIEHGYTNSQLDAMLGVVFEYPTYNAFTIEDNAVLFDGNIDIYTPYWRSRGLAAKKALPASKIQEMAESLIITYK